MNLSPGEMALGAFVWGVFFWGLGVFINGLARRPVVNPGRLAAVMLLLAMAVNLLFMGAQPNPEKAGRIVGIYALPLLGFGLVAWRFKA